MKNMDRRDFLKLASLTGIGLMTASLPFRSNPEAAMQFFMITENPDRDVNRLLQSVGISSGDEMQITSTPIQPAGQDLSIMWNGRITDPLKEETIQLSIRSFAATLRRRKHDGQYLVTVSNLELSGRNTAIFEYNGKVIEQVSLKKDYNSIEIPGEIGSTEFEIRDGNVTVIKSSCRNHLCENQGGVSSGRIVCAPNKLVANVSNGIRQVDSITG